MLNISNRGMYPKDCYKIQPSDATTFQLIAVTLSYLFVTEFNLLEKNL